MIWYATVSKGGSVKMIHSSGENALEICWNKDLNSRISVSVVSVKPIVLLKTLTDDGYVRSNDDKPNFDVKRKVQEAADVLNNYISTSGDVEPNYLRVQDTDKNER